MVWRLDANLDKALEQADLSHIDTSKSIGSFSGDQRTRIALVVILASRYDVMLLDEPTNNLDIPSVEALETAINGFGGGILFVSHDRDFVEHVRPTQVITLSSAD